MAHLKRHSSTMMKMRWAIRFTGTVCSTEFYGLPWTARKGFADLFSYQEKDLGQTGAGCRIEMGQQNSRGALAQTWNKKNIAEVWKNIRKLASGRINYNKRQKEHVCRVISSKGREVLWIHWNRNIRFTSTVIAGSFGIYLKIWWEESDSWGKTTRWEDEQKNSLILSFPDTIHQARYFGTGNQLTNRS